MFDRSVEYEFKRGELKGASFKGSMTQASSNNWMYSPIRRGVAKDS